VTPLRAILSHLCGMPRRVRDAKILIMPKVFVDESSDGKSFLMGAWLFHPDEWEHFSDAWLRELHAHKHIGYFNHNEAMAQKEQFEGWTERERDSKIWNLGSLIAKYKVTGFIGGIHLPNFQAIFQDSVVPRKTLRSIVTFTDPYHWAFNCIVSGILGHQIEIARNLTEKVDFVFDKGLSYLDDCIANYLKLIAVLPSAAQRIAGTVIPEDDRDVVALQAADLLVGQMAAEIKSNGKRPAALEMLRKSKDICIFNCLRQKPDLKNLSLVNIAWSTMQLENIKKGKGRKK
jgi:hypothetical protein